MAGQDKERWTRIVATFEESGQSQREFAKEQDLSLSNCGTGPAGCGRSPDRSCRSRLSAQ